MNSDDDLLPISALQHYLYCSRQCALIHLEQVWSENRFTVEGNQMHANVHDGPGESRPGIRISRGLPVVSHRLGLSGQCDVVEFHTDGTVLPIEYKRGKPKAHRADDVQVAAQAFALEEMLGIEISSALIFYGRTHRRFEVTLDPPLRALCTDLAARLHDLIDSRSTPAAEYEKRKCDACSLIELCKPKAAGRSASRWIERQLSMASMPSEDWR